MNVKKNEIDKLELVRIVVESHDELGVIKTG